MKKIFIAMSLLSVLFTGVKAADDGYRRTWDFTKGWSEQTIQKLEADPTNWETQATGFQNKVAMTANETPWVMVDGVKEPIAELVGMTINSSLAKAKHCQICTTGSGLADVPCFWLNGKGDVVSVKVPAGENVRFGYTAHGTSDRGFKCGGGFADANGTTQFTSTDNQQIHEVELINSNAEESTLTLTTVNGGCHIYYIIIGEGDEEQQVDPKTYNVAYVYDGSYNGAKDADKNPIGYAANGGLTDGDPLYTSLEDNFTMIPLDVNSAEIKALSSTDFNDSLMKFDVVILSEAVGSGNTYAKGMLDIINKVPMVNLKSFMYKSGVWSMGAGVNPSTKAVSVKVGEDFLDHPLFADVNIDDEGNIVLFNSSEVAGGNLVQGYTTTAGSLFEGDDVLATVANGEEAVNAIHVHSNRNQYILLPLSSDNLLVGGDWNVSDDAQKLVVNAVKVVAATKTKVTPVVKPTITQLYGDGITSVVLACGNKAAKIYYTLDGTDPTIASTLYTDTFTITAEGVEVKALAVAQGYDDSEIASATIIVKTQTAVPEIAVNGNVVTISCAEEGAIYYNYNGITDEKLSSAYEGEITVPENTKIYAFAVASNKLASNLVSARVYVSPTQQDTLSVFDPNETDWFKNVVLLDFKKDTLETPTSNWSSSAAYYFGKSAWKYYSDEVDHTEVVYEADGVTPVKSLVDPAADSLKTIYKVNPESVKYAHSTTAQAWYLFSQGQPFTGETTLAPENGVGNGAASRYADKAEDLIGAPTKGVLTFGGKSDGDPYTAAVISTDKYVGPFDIVTYIGNGNGNGMPIMVAEVSADGENWTRLDTIPLSSTQRYFKKHRVSYTENAEVYVRIANVGGASKAQIYNIYLLSGNMEINPEAGIEDITADETAKSQGIFDLQGRQVSKMVPGQLYIQNGKKVVVR
ncbi:MAG: chitobiase/beta-hexosaminidase C-terminal domain-containing protein [Bacteroidales bacterium]|nr:chitobiase/beta-hexosaminidase C-terminal domain-containing protein [Bacteroidales bacterium]